MKKASMSEIISKKQAWGPFLIIIGSYSVFMWLSQTTSIGIIHYFGIGIASILVIAGIFVIFHQLKAEDKSLSISTVSKEKSPAILEHAVIQLSKNYEVLRRQTTQGFLLAGIFMTLGFIVILSGLFGQFIGLSDTGSDLSSAAGIIMEFISGTSLLVYRINFKRLNKTSDKLESTWRVLTAYRFADSLPEGKKSDATMKLIDALISPGSP